MAEYGQYEIVVKSSQALRFSLNENRWICLKGLCAFFSFCSICSHFVSDNCAVIVLSLRRQTDDFSACSQKLNFEIFVVVCFGHTCKKCFNTLVSFQIFFSISYFGCATQIDCCHTPLCPKCCSIFVNSWRISHYSWNTSSRSENGRWTREAGASMEFQFQNVCGLFMDHVIQLTPQTTANFGCMP